MGGHYIVCMTDADVSHQSDSTPIPGLVIGLLITMAAIAGAASLMMSFHSLRDLVQRVEDVHGWLSNVGPVGIDGLQLASLFAIVITATARFRVRLYLWVLFFGSIALSVAGNCVDASARHAGTAGIVLSGVWPALLAAATHVVVIAVRWWQESRPVATVQETLAPVEDAEPVSAPPAWDTPTGAVEVVGKKPATPAQIQAWARQRYQRGGVSCEAVATAMTAKGYTVSAKQVERWTKDLRAAVAVAEDEPVLEPV